MNDGEMVAKSIRSGEWIEVVWRNGKITELAPTTERPGEGVWMAPPLVDLQINGYGGVDFQSERLTSEDLLSAVRGLRSAGCTRFLLTLVTDEWSRLVSRLQHLHRVREASAELRAAISGWHIEGPFLSAQPGFHGAHNPTLMRDPSAALISELREAVPGDPLMITLAPEREGSLEAIRKAVSLGIRVSLGHTDVSADRLLEAVRAGASDFTHLGNGCPQTLDRHDNIFWRVLNQPGLRVGLIPDGIHVSPGFFKIVHRVVPAGNIVYVSDAMSAAGAPPGRYRLGAMELEVGEDQIVRKPGSALFAGSALRPVDGVFRAARMLEGRWQDAWLRFSDIPATLMGLEVGLRIGAPADFCLVTTTATNELESLRTVVDGN